MAARKPPFKAGSKIGRYKVLDLIGEGSTGYVFLAEQPVVNRKLAIKVLANVSKARIAALHDEAKRLARLDHQNIVELYDVGKYKTYHYIAEEYIEGRSLEQILTSGEKLQMNVVLQIARAVAGALAHAHDRGVIHRDIKPANIVVDQQGMPVICDLSPSPIVTGTSKRGAKALVGTPAYLSPELARGEEATPRTDVWGVGATIYHLVAGRPPYVGGSVQELIDKAASDEPVDLAPMVGRSPECVMALVGHCLDKKAETRYASADELRRAIEAVIDYLEASVAEATAILPPKQGQAILLHVEREESEQRGAYREYEIQNYLGGGTFGDVFRAAERLSDRTVALKILRREWVSDTSAVARFRREAHVLARFAHPNIVGIRNYGRYGSSFFIAMDYIEGLSLRDALKSSDGMDMKDVARITSDVLAAVAAAHEAGIVHRDLKPANVMLVAGRAVLCDFGMAYALDMSKVTATGAVLGSPSYMAPEQAKGFDCSAQSDVYSVGVLLYEMLTKKLPHDALTVGDVLMAIATKPPDPITTWRKDLPEALVDVLGRMLRTKPEERPSASEARQAILHTARLAM